MTKRKYSDINRHSIEYRPFVDALREFYARQLEAIGFENVRDHYDDTILSVAFDSVEELLNRMSDVGDKD